MNKAFVILFSLCGLTTKAQNISNLSFNTESDKIVIVFDLNGEENKFYKLEVSFNDRSGNKIVPKSLQGDYPYATPGMQQKIIWDVLKDEEELSGDLCVTIKIVDAKQISMNGGPGNVFLSAVMPGWGDVYVNNEDAAIKPGYIALTFLGSLGLGYYSHQKYKENYSAYQSAQDQSYIDEYYTNADFYRKQTRFWYGMAAIFWTADVLHVLIKGFNNERENNSALNALSIRTNHGTIALCYKF